MKLIIPGQYSIIDSDNLESTTSSVYRIIESFQSNTIDSSYVQKLNDEYGEVVVLYMHKGQYICTRISNNNITGSRLIIVETVNFESKMDIPVVSCINQWQQQKTATPL